ncbi:MAG: tRNA uridine-5-carboxymethylaminomethyl(34) synthesis GTPase MnmE [Ezakiella sp.]|nr:tRNA uridine-5-carboxymethylaminomethyl(34) synthesis GTPase MnmE [Ezakiella sp.]
MRTIAAIATPPGRGGIGIVRMSGDESLNILKNIFKTNADIMPRYMHYGHIVYDNEVVDECLACYFKAPKTYTREDMVEIYCHGGYVTSLYIYEILLKLGAVPAEAGEFTKLAFLNGRIDLLEAEAVEGIIDSQTKEEQGLYTKILGGKLSEKLESLIEELLNLIAECEAKIDYPELGDVDDMEDKINFIVERIDQFLQDEKRSNYIREGIKTAIIGRPNVGKSSLLNAITNKERAIVTEIPGTTRDTIEEYISYDGLYLHLIDTAGIRETEEIVESKGIELSHKAAREADIVIVVLDGSESLNKGDIEILESVSDKEKIIVVNKEDKGIELDISRLDRYGDKILIASLKEDRGVRELMQMIKEIFITDIDGEYLSVFNIRHKEALLSARENLYLARRDIDLMPFEIVEVSLRLALDDLYSILGRSGDEDLIDRVFQDFCVGK